MIKPLPESYFKSLETITTYQGKPKVRKSPLAGTHAFLFGKAKDNINRAWAAYLALKGYSSWQYSSNCSLEEVQKYATISSNYYKSL